MPQTIYFLASSIVKSNPEIGEKNETQIKHSSSGSGRSSDRSCPGIRKPRDGALGIVYVSSQGLYYDTFVTAETLPMRGRFQKLENGVTEFGPGTPGYLGGRWWVDVNGNNIMDKGDNFLLCPLLGPGRTSP